MSHRVPPRRELPEKAIQCFRFDTPQGFPGSLFTPLLFDHAHFYCLQLVMRGVTVPCRGAQHPVLIASRASQQPLGQQTVNPTSTYLHQQHNTPFWNQCVDLLQSKKKTRCMFTTLALLVTLLAAA